MKNMNGFAALQSLGKALMLPVAVLPVAGLLLRLGQPDLLDIDILSAAGQAIFSNLGLMFAIGVSVGLARENDGAAGLSGAVCFLVAQTVAKLFVEAPTEMLADQGAAAVAVFKDAQLAKFSVPAGLLSGIIAGVFYNRYASIKLPDYLAFFGGRRFVPIISALAGLCLGVGLGAALEQLDAGMRAFSEAILSTGSFGVFIFGLLNRILIVTGLHHIINNVAWFTIGEFEGVTGDLTRFFAGDPEAGMFMTGFFPVMMFGLPAACLAMYHAAPSENRKTAAGLYMSMALTSFLTGVTEPIEFIFMFAAPVLFAIHAVLTGLSLAICEFLGAKMGFGFSAGFLDFAINYRAGTNPHLVILVGLFYAAVYYALFSVAIRFFNLSVPGMAGAANGASAEAPGDDLDKARGYLGALGGAGNIVTLGACMTRLRLEVSDRARVDEAALTSLGAVGVAWPSDTALQVVIGPAADRLQQDISRVMKEGGAAVQKAPSEEQTGFAAVSAATAPQGLLAALGGAENVEDLQLYGGRRLQARLRDGALAHSGSDLMRVEATEGKGDAHFLLINPEWINALTKAA